MDLEPRQLAGAEGFEPSNTGSKVPRLTAWPRPNIVHCGVPQRPAPRVTAPGVEKTCQLHDWSLCRDLRSGPDFPAQTVSLYDARRSRQVVDTSRDSAC